MSKKMLIEATHPEETRVVVLDDARLEELDVETSTKKQIKGNIYLAKVVRVEPSLQAAFVEYGGNRHGFLAFNEIHPDYYQLPSADLELLKKEMLQEAAREEEQEEVQDKKNHKHSDDVETVSDSDNDDVLYRPRRFSMRKYRIQEVIHHGQIMLVQVTKEERGNKGAAMTTYLSLAGRYSVLMPKNANSGGVSRKIANVADRKRLKKIVEGLPVLEGQSVIVRTAGKERTKAEIKRDFDYLNKTWSDIVEKTMQSIAPALIHEEANLIKRTLRDAMTDDIEEIIIEGDDAYKNAKNFLKLLMPRQVKKIKEYKKDVPLFQAYNIETQMEEMIQKTVHLKSGGYLVIDQAEALVAIDVNSGRATRERNIEETALKTNLEAADEVARQMRLRDLAGLVVIDFIDMEESKNNYAVERRMKEALKKDRARIQMGRITGFGLMELSRQRLRSSLLETGHHVCPMCQGCGFVRSEQSCAMHALHVLEEAGHTHNNYTITITLPLQIALYVLNNKRDSLAQIENRYDVILRVEGDASMIGATEYRLEYQANPQRDKKGFFARAVETLLPGIVKTEEEVPPPVKQEPKKNARPERREGTKSARKEVKEQVEGKKETITSASEKGEKNNNRRRDRRSRNRGKEKGVSTTIPVNTETVSTSGTIDSNTEEKFKVVEQGSMAEFTAPSTEVTKPVPSDVVAVAPAVTKVEAVAKPAAKRTRAKKTTAQDNEKEVGEKEVNAPAVKAVTKPATPAVEKVVAPKAPAAEKTEKPAAKPAVVSEPIHIENPKKGWWNK